MSNFNRMKHIAIILMSLVFIQLKGQSVDNLQIKTIAAVSYDTIRLPFPKQWESFEFDTLSIVELDQVNNIINRCIQENQQKKGDATIFGNHIGNHIFYKQVIPFKNDDGEKIIYVNAFCESFANEDWMVNYKHISGGGTCHFNVYINLSKEEYYDLNCGGR
jgi:hypothetical protein